MSFRKSVTERSRESKNYNLYCINFHGSGLETIKNVFKTQVQTGLRRPVYIIDVDEINAELESEKRNSQDSRKSLKQTTCTRVLQAIQACCQQFDYVNKKIAEELKFDIYQYWLKDIEEKQRASTIDAASQRDNTSLNLKESGKTSAKRKSKVNKTKRASRKSEVSTKSEGKNEKAEEELSCIPVVVREHNRVGQPEMLSKRKYIEDNPEDGKLYIILLGQFNDEFYLELLRYGQPILGIMNFIPTESNYDLLINNTKLRSFIESTLESIENSIYEFRQIVSMKPVGLFTHQLSILSPCMASKLQRDIFDQFSWSVYDIEVLYHHYELYYYKPFHLYNVNLPLDVDLRETQEIAESLKLSGHFQNTTLPGSSSDYATTAVYLNSLLNTCGPLDLSYNGSEFSFPIPENGGTRPTSSIFSNIAKIRKFGRFFVDGGNVFLNNMLMYNEPQGVQKIRPICLDYYLWKPYVTQSHSKELEMAKTMATLEEVIPLPGYIQLYLNEDSCKQKIFKLFEKHDNFEIKDMGNYFKMYTFYETHSSIEESEQMFILPSRLCFRDFTLFQKEEFLENLITPEMRKVSLEEARRQSLEKGGLEKKMEMLQLDEEIFIRPNSLKALKLLEAKSSADSVSPQAKERRSSRLKSRQYNKKLSLKEDRRQSQDWVGLPPGHPLLKGYNLEDIRQEIKLKTSKYYFDHGHMELYEERWCFQDMNQTLKIAIKDYHLFLNRPRFQDKGISKNIRLETQDNVNIRIFNEIEANARIVMNYPNGLSVYHLEMHCEQIWSSDSTFNGERRRIVTPYGVVIVFFKANDVITIMRYNGEVYRLYQHDLEEGEEENILCEFSNNQSSENIDPNGQGDYQRKRLKSNNDAKLNNEAKNYSSSDATIFNNSSNTTNWGEALKASIDDELKFLLHICTLYELSYMHLGITTSQGKRFHVTRQGKVFEEKLCVIQEWHDYFANESYCQRNDGVKIIWTQDALRCYHTDGTVFTTETEEKTHTFGSDEFDSQISQSSSHILCEEEEDIEIDLKSENMKRFSHFKAMSTECPEEYEDERFVNYICNRSWIQHASYAGVHIKWLDASAPNQSPIIMEILGINGIILYTLPGDSNQRNSCEKHYAMKDQEGVSEKAKQLVVHLWIGDCLHFSVDVDGLEISVKLERKSILEEEKNIERDSLVLRLSYADCLTDVFKHWVNQIATFYQYNGQIKKQLYFVEKEGKGFEFLEALPQSSDYIFNCGNCILQAHELKTINEMMEHKIEYFQQDMNKFPRFHCTTSKKPNKDDIYFPIISSLRVYCKIPTQLQNSQNICQFMETLENVEFKKLQSKMKERVEFHLRPQSALKVKRNFSIVAWQKRHQQHEKRKAVELQRKGLYHAMIKHCKYPKYFDFMSIYEGHVRYLNFFEFLLSKCQNEEVKREEVYWDLKKETNNVNSLNSKSRRSKSSCKYGTYDEP